MKRSGFSASVGQREKVAGMPCVACKQGPTDPAHVVSRAQGGCDDPLCVVPLCRRCHTRFDTRDLDLLPFLEPGFREELGHALGHVGLIGLLRRVTAERNAA